MQESPEQLDLGLRHIEERVHPGNEGVMGTQKRDLFDEIVLHCLLDALIEELGVARGVEVPIELRGVVQDFVIPFAGARARRAKA
jgi:hypothetical protein